MPCFLAGRHASVRKSQRLALDPDRMMNSYEGSRPNANRSSGFLTCRLEVAGNTIEAARNNAARALASHLQLLVASGDVIPAPSSLIEIVSDLNGDPIGSSDEMTAKLTPAERVDSAFAALVGFDPILLTFSFGVNPTRTVLIGYHTDITGGMLLRKPGT